MKIKSTISTIMFYLFSMMAIIAFVIVGSIDDISSETFAYYVAIFGVFLSCVAIASAFYDYRIYARHLFAVKYLIEAMVGCYLGKKSEKYVLLYRVFVDQKTIKNFYNFMLHLYDYSSKDVKTLRTRMNRY